MDENIKINGATLKDEMFCHYSYSKEVSDGITDSVTWKSRLPVHRDLLNAFRKLNIHLALICEEVAEMEIDDIDETDAVLIRPEGMAPDEFEKQLEGIHKKLYAFVVTAISYEGTGENEGVSLTGKKKLSTGEWLHLTTPKITWSDAYYFINELQVAAGDVAEEVGLYMQGKQAPRIIQTEMSFPDDEDEEEVKPKRRGRKGSKTNPVQLEG